MEKVSEARKNKKAFKDIEIPNTLSSILVPEENNGGVSEEMIDFYRTLKWQRAS